MRSESACGGLVRTVADRTRAPRAVADSALSMGCAAPSTDAPSAPFVESNLMGSREHPIDVDKLDEPQREDPSPLTPLQKLPGRAQLEAERLARQAARQASDDPPRKRARTERQTPAVLPRYVPITAQDRFWNGAFKATYNMHTPAQPGTQLAEAILPTTRRDPAGVQRVVLASFDVDIDWLESLFPDVPITYVGNPAHGPGAPASGLYPRGFWEMCVPPSVHPRALQHIKLVVLYYHDRLRVVVSSGNLTPLDWMRYDNTFYIQDFARGMASGDFWVQLKRVYASFGIKKHPAVDMLSAYDLGKAGAHLVASWPIAHTVKGWDKMAACGLGRLHHVARKLQVGDCTLEAQGSSLAAYDRRWLEQFWLVACGCDPAVLPLPRTNPKAPAPWPPIRILFPTQRWVEEESVDGIGGGGCFFGRADEFERRGLRHLFAQPDCIRGRLFMHAKCILAECTSGDHKGGWVYAGSANFTRAAWGTISGTRVEPTLSLSNWELGVVVPLDAHLDCSPLDAVPYRRPVRPYGPTDTPWDVRTLIGT